MEHPPDTTTPHLKTLLCCVCWPVSVQPVVCFGAEDVGGGRGAGEFCGQEGCWPDGEKGERESQHISDISMEVNLALLYFIHTPPPLSENQRFQVTLHVASMN